MSLMTGEGPLHRNFESAFRYAAIGMALVGPGARFLRVNPAFCRLTGYDEAELLELSVYSLTLPEERVESDRLVHELWAGERESYELEKRYVRKDGAQVWVLLSVSAVRNAEGVTEHVVAQVQDITERRAAEAARREGDLRYRAISQTSSDIIVLTNIDGVVEDVSASVERYGWRACDIVGRAFLPFLHPDDRRKVEKAAHDIFTAGRVDRLRWRARPSDEAAWRWFESSACLLSGGEAHEVKILDIVRDIHSEVEAARFNEDARAAAEDAARAKSQFLANISHEIRTPLTAVLGFTDVLRRRDDLPPEVQAQLALIAQAGQGLQALVNDVIDFTKLESDQFELRPRPARLDAAVNEMLALFSDAAARAGLQLSVHIDPEMMLAREFDPDRLRQILTNLVHNAIKFTARGGVDVRLISHPRADWATIEVADTGPGIALDAQTRLFKRFSQVDGARNRTHGGAGLGLAICRAIAELMGGDLTLSSAPGEGSTFRLRIPAPLAATMVDEQSPAPPTLADARVLVVDDSPANLLVAVKLLEVFDAEPTCAASGKAALEILASAPFDVVLMDIRMPEMDGIETLRMLRGRGGLNQQTPVLAFTADADTLGDAFTQFDGRVAKPIRPDALAHEIARVLGAGHAGPSDRPSPRASRARRFELHAPGAPNTGRAT